MSFFFASTKMKQAKIIKLVKGPPSQVNDCTPNDAFQYNLENK